MKKIYFLSFMLFCLAINNVNAQQDSLEEYNSDRSFITIDYKSQKADFGTRVGNGVTLITPIFEGELWEEDAKGAVTYACRLMEEFLPTAYPIKIKMMRSSNDPPVPFTKSIIRYNYTVSSPLPDFPFYLTVPLATIKRLWVIPGSNEFNIMDNNNWLEDGSIYFSTDDIFSTRTDGEVDANKYDLVTATLRELARVITMNVPLTLKQNKLTFTKTNYNDNQKYVTPYGYAVIGDASFDESQALQYTISNNATLHQPFSSSFSVNIQPIHSPSNFNKNKSLLYFKEDINNDSTRLLQPELPMQTAIHKIGSPFRDVLKQTLWYNLNVAVGTEYPVLSISDQSVNNAIGTLSFSHSGVSSNSSHSGFNSSLNEELKVLNKDQIIRVDTIYGGIAQSYLSRQKTNEMSVTVSDYPYSGYYHADAVVYNTENFEDLGISLYLLKKDGNLERIAHQSYAFIPLIVDFSTIPNIEDYARTSDGYLRARLNFNGYMKSGQFGRLPDGSGYGQLFNTVRYLCLDYKPAKSQLKQKQFYQKSAPVDPNDYYREVNLAFDNMEGVTSAKLLKKEYDETGGMLSINSYNVTPTEGQCIAEVDNELTTTFQLISYNALGNTSSNIISIPPLATQENYILKTTNNEDLLTFQFFDSKKNYNIKNEVSSIHIANVSNTQVFPISVVRNNTIHINNLPKGVYILLLTDKKGRVYNSKFIK